ncbi:MAG TPA: hypothetical protein PLC52_05375 [Anaerolineales bacterium]|nr:hypothetical protein [Anaerolineales bacterium]HRQ92279.1 hypothetical protein [Anaerolineales bacterium]
MKPQKPPKVSPILISLVLIIVSALSYGIPSFSMGLFIICLLCSIAVGIIYYKKPFDRAKQYGSLVFNLIIVLASARTVAPKFFSNFAQSLLVLGGIYIIYIVLQLKFEDFTIRLYRQQITPKTKLGQQLLSFSLASIPALAVFGAQFGRLLGRESLKAGVDAPWWIPGLLAYYLALVNGQFMVGRYLAEKRAGVLDRPTPRKRKKR